MFEPRSGEFELNSFVFSKYRLSYLFLSSCNLSKKFQYDIFRKDRVSHHPRIK